MNASPWRVILIVGVIALASAATVVAHAGPPFPVLSDVAARPYVISLWTDPDATQDGSAGGQFWIVLQRTDGPDPVPSTTEATIAVRPVGRTGTERSAQAMPVRGDVGNQFAGVVLDHEGMYAVHVTVAGPLGPAAVDALVDATYDLRPPPAMILVYVAPFLLAGALWAKLLLRRRNG